MQLVRLRCDKRSEQQFLQHPSHVDARFIPCRLGELAAFPVTVRFRWARTTELSLHACLRVNFVAIDASNDVRTVAQVSSTEDSAQASSQLLFDFPDSQSCAAFQTSSRGAHEQHSSAITDDSRRRAR